VWRGRERAFTLRGMIDPSASERPAGVAATAAAFCAAFDAGDHGACGRMMAPGCVLREGALEVVGPEAVVATWRSAHVWAERGFDELRVVSEVVRVAGGAVTLAATTMFMRMPGRWHRLRARRALTIDVVGRIVAIAQDCEPAAAAAFREYALQCGAGEPPAGLGL
jgi:hypothetical protein